MIISKTPFRISFCGGGTDYPNWIASHPGIVVGTTINKYSYISVRKLPRFHEYKNRLVYSKIETKNSFDEIEHNSIRETLKRLRELYGFPECGMEIFHASDLPGSTGTGSSSAFTVGLLNALAALDGKYMSPAELTREAILIEQQRMKETVGCQDQAWASYGNMNIIKFMPNQEISVTPITMSVDDISIFEKHCLLFFTGISRISGEIAKTYANDLINRGKEQWALIRLTEQFIENLYKMNFAKLGEILDQTWRIKAHLSDKVCSAEISKIYNTARIYGAYGGKLMGAGGGGCIFLLANPEKHDTIIKNIASLGAMHIPFRFEMMGSSIIFANRT